MGGHGTTQDRAALDAALSSDALRMLFQPVVDLTTGELVGHEALARGPKGSALEKPQDLFAAVVGAVRAGADAALPVLPVAEALKRVDGERVVGNLDKADVVLAQTPQAFRADVLRRLHAGCPEVGEDVELVVDAGGDVRPVPGDPRNVHVTTEGELAVAELLAITSAPRRRPG